MIEGVEKTDKCGHAQCKCAATRDGEYCSDYCENAASGLDAECKCGHAECD